MIRAHSLGMCELPLPHKRSQKNPSTEEKYRAPIIGSPIGEGRAAIRWPWESSADHNGAITVQFVESRHEIRWVSPIHAIPRHRRLGQST